MSASRSSRSSSGLRRSGIRLGWKSTPVRHTLRSSVRKFKDFMFTLRTAGLESAWQKGRSCGLQLCGSFLSPGRAFDLLIVLWENWAFVLDADLVFELASARPTAPFNELGIQTGIEWRCLMLSLEN